jgi:hypothetical protein
VSVAVEAADLIEPWIYATLSADAGLAAEVGEDIFGSLTPDEPNSVYVTFALMSLRDVRGVGPDSKLSVDSIYLVKAVAPASGQDAVAPAARRISLLLDGAEIDTPDGHITCTRETTISYSEVTDGQPFVHLGFTFRIRAN